MSTPSKRKGTQGETELLRQLGIPGLVRTPASSRWDLSLPGRRPSIAVLAIRPDRGRWLLMVDADDFLKLWNNGQIGAGLNIEVKRYARSSVHTIYEEKFGGRL